MITIPNNQDSLLQSGRYAVNIRLELSATSWESSFWAEVESYSGMDPILSAEWSHSIDDPCASGSIRIAAWDTLRNVNLSPLVENSAFNTQFGTVEGSGGDVGFRPGRYFRLYVSITSPGPPSSVPDWRLCFFGRIDNVLIEDEDLVLQVRGPEANQMDHWIEQTFDTGGVSVIQTMNLITSLYGAVNNPFRNAQSYNFIQPGPGGTSPTLVPEYTQEIMPVMEALNRLKLLIGHDLRVKIQTPDNFYWHLYDPEFVTGSLWTFSADNYVAVPNLTINGDDVRNVGYISYKNGLRIGPIVDNVSIGKYQRRPMWLFEDATSPIDTTPEATEMITRAIRYLAEPMVSFGMTVPFFWAVELNDLYTFQANGYHFNTDRQFYISGYRHVLENGEGETTLNARVRPAAAWRQYLNSVPVKTMIDFVPPVDGINFAAEYAVWYVLDPIA